MDSRVDSGTTWLRISLRRRRGRGNMRETSSRRGVVNVLVDEGMYVDVVGCTSIFVRGDREGRVGAIVEYQVLNRR